MQILDNVPCADRYVDPGPGVTNPASIEFVINSNGGYFSLVNNPAYMQLAYYLQGQIAWTKEVPVPVGVGTIFPGTAGIRFRNYTAGQVANVSAAISESKEPTLNLGSGGIASSGVTAIVTAVNIAGLGTPADGKQGLIIAGANPFEFIPVVYSAAYGHWVSQEYNMFDSSTLNYGYNTIGENDIDSHRASHNYKVFQQAGLLPQFRSSGLIGKSSNVTNSVVMQWGMQMATNNEGGTEASAGAYTATFGLVSKAVIGANVIGYDSDWVAPGVYPTVGDRMTLKWRANVADAADAKLWLAMKTVMRFIG